MTFDCSICKSICNIPHWLPCRHTFCFLCIRRHLEKRNFCPACFKSPYSPSDLRTNIKQYNKIDKLPIIVNFKEDQILKELRKRKVIITGDKFALIQRYRELFINVDKERFRETPRNMDTIVRHLNKDIIDNRKIYNENEKDHKNTFKKLNELKIELNKNKSDKYCNT